MTLPKDISADIKTFTKHVTKGFRTVRVRVNVGQTEWLTSLFPSKEAEAYMLAIKADVRKAEGLIKGYDVNVKLSVMI